MFMINYELVYGKYINKNKSSRITSPSCSAEISSATASESADYHCIPESHSQMNVSQISVCQPPQLKSSQMDIRHDEIYAAMVASVNKSKSRKKTLHIVVIALVIVLLVLLGVYIMKIGNEKKTVEPNAGQYQLDGIEYDNSDHETEANETTANALTSDSEEATQNKYNSINKAYDKYYDIVSDEYNTANGTLIDLDNDSIEELIIPCSSNDSFAIHSKENGRLNEKYFGKYMSVSNCVLYKVHGNNGSEYIYYCDNYAYQSCQGYYNSETEESIDIYIKYVSDDGENYTAEWEIGYSSPDYDYTSLATGSEAVESFYDNPDDCHTELFYQLNQYSFDIDDDSDCIDITYLHDELTEVISKILSFSEENAIGHGYVATDEDSTLNLRSAPFNSADIVARIPYNEVVVIHEDSDDWYCVSYEDDYGYVTKQYIDAYIYN